MTNLSDILGSYLGPQGPQGLEGRVGLVGNTGEVGPTGSVGPQGFQGPIGFRGYQGMQGNIGPQGFQGLVGPQGLNGVSGLPGTPGADGADGTDGDKYLGTSTSMNSISLGTKIFSTQTDLSYTTGQYVIVSYDASNTIYGDVISYSGSTLTVNATDYIGSGLRASWTINLSGAPGTSGEDGTQGPQGSDGIDGDTYATTSTTSNSISTGNKTFIVPEGLSYTTGQSIIIAYDVSNTLEGTVVLYDKYNLDVNISTARGSGTYTSWTINLAGAPGPAGDTGPQGIPGRDGSDGFQGDRGPQGFIGQDGNQGPVGLRGFQGFSGQDGNQGISGPQGPIGDEGPQGPLGNPGLDGDIYATTSTTSNSISTGNKTFIVPQGLSYTTGQSVIIAYDASNTLEGTVVLYDKYNLDVNISTARGSGTYTSWTINLSGTPGPTGDIGPQGIAGRDGSDGQDGVQGPQGLQGSNGTIGVDGVQGPQGLQGSNGTIGVDGVQGPQGLQGSNGTIGVDGVQGPQGLQGSNGTIGVDGVQGPQGLPGSDISGVVLNGLTGSITLVSTDLDNLIITENGQNIELEVLTQRSITEDVKNVSGVTLYKGTPLHITGSTGNEAEVVPADAKFGLDAHLVLNEDLTNGSSGKAIAMGFINNVSIPDTTNFQPSTEVYLAEGGGFTHIKPQGTNSVQYLGVVLRASTTSGPGNISGIIQNLGTVTELPNIPNKYIWMGDSNGVAQETNSLTLHVGSADTSSSSTTSNTINIFTASSDTNYSMALFQGSPGDSKPIYGDSESNTPAWNPVSNTLTIENTSITGNLEVGSIADVESTIATMSSDIVTLNSDVTNLYNSISPTNLPINTITQTGGSVKLDSTMINKLNILTSSVDIDVLFESVVSGGYDLPIETEVYFMQMNTGVVNLNSTGPSLLLPFNNIATTRGQYSIIAVKCIYDSSGTGEYTVVVFGDLKSN